MDDNKYSLTDEEIKNLKRYAFNKTDLMLSVNEMIDGNFCIKPIRWSVGYTKGKMSEGKYIALFNTKENAIDALVRFCDYSMGLALILS